MIGKFPMPTPNIGYRRVYIIPRWIRISRPSVDASADSASEFAGAVESSQIVRTLTQNTPGALAIATIKQAAMTIPTGRPRVDPRRTNHHVNKTEKMTLRKPPREAVRMSIHVADPIVVIKRAVRTSERRDM